MVFCKSLLKRIEAQVMHLDLRGFGVKKGQGNSRNENSKFETARELIDWGGGGQDNSVTLSGARREEFFGPYKRLVRGFAARGPARCFKNVRRKNR